METPLDPMKALLADRKRAEKELKKAELQYQKIANKALAELRDTIVKLCGQAGTSVEELFGVKVQAVKAAQSARGTKKPRGEKKKSAPRKKGPGKYFLKGKEVDGRQARAMKAFDSVRVDGKIDDAKAIAAKMINPGWLASGGPIVKRFVEQHKLDAAKYTAK